ncbi:hypothetical protein F5X97DRAFT_323840 [Nemania serpens]|nr:hypothetical protein F5X97DRAFT_323840 [Nemania serpens]
MTRRLLPVDPCPLLFHGRGQSGFQYFAGASWKPVDYILDNGMNGGYAGYSQGHLVGNGKLAVFDEIDKEMDVLYGGPLSFGWVTHFPDDHRRPPPPILVNYQTRKREFRRYFATLPRMPGIGLSSFLSASIGTIVYRLAHPDPTNLYGIGNTDDSSTYTYSAGYNGRHHTFPTITSDLEYYNALFDGTYDMLDWLFPFPGNGFDITTSNTDNTGTRSDGS